MKTERGSKSGETLLKYGRDYLLQLRMHPMSLHKPNLPDHEIVKDRLYLHQVDNVAFDIPVNPYSENFRTLMRPENIAKFLHQYSYPSGYIPRNSSFYGASGQKSNSAFPLSKFQHPSFSPSYYNNSVQKRTYRPSPNYNTDLSTDDFFENITDVQTAPWFKEVFPMCASENAWNMNQNTRAKNVCSSKGENVNLKVKKKLSIIDPKTGKDILDEIGETSTTPSQSSISSKENTEDEMKNLQPENTANNTEVPDDQEKHVSMNGIYIISDKECQQASASEKQSGDNVFLSLSHDYGDFLDQYSGYRSSTKKTEANQNHTVFEKSEKKMYENMMNSESHAGNVTSYSNSDMDFSVDTMENEEFDKSYQNVMEMLAPFNTNSVSDRAQINSARQRSNDSNLKERINILRDKIYAMRQEQQKMLILQSFLRFKKHQLDESFRSLDDKKIDMVNWEYNLYNKAKKLLEKEQWIETQTRNLKKKEKELEEKETWLNLKVREMEHKHCDILKKDAKNASKEEKSSGIPKESGKEDVLSEKETVEKMASGKGDHLKYSSNPKTAGNYNKTRVQSVDYSSGDVCAPTSVSNHKLSIVSKPLLNDKAVKVEISGAINESNSHKKMSTVEGESEKYDNDLRKALKEKKITQFYLNDNTSSHVSETQNTSGKQQKYKLDKLDDSGSSYNKKRMYLEGRKYYPEHIKYWLNQREMKATEETVCVQNKNG